MNFYQQHTQYYVSVDCIIFGFRDGELSLLLLKRRFEPALGKWSLMGGFLQPEESADDAAKRVLADLTGLKGLYLEQLGAYSETKRDPGERVISIAYYALVNIDSYNHEFVEQNNAHWVRMNELPELIFDHQQMVGDALTCLRSKAKIEPIGFNLLSNLFTLTQLQLLYEAIYNEEIDKRNFRKKVAEMDFVEKTDKIDKRNSRRGAALYRFNMKMYRKSNGFKL